MTYFDLYNEVKEMDSAEEIKVIIKKALLEELAGEDFSIKEVKRKDPVDEKEVAVKKELRKQIKALEEKEGKKLTSKEKGELKKQIEEQLK